MSVFTGSTPSPCPRVPSPAPQVQPSVPPQALLTPWLVALMPAVHLVPQTHSSGPQTHVCSGSLCLGDRGSSGASCPVPPSHLVAAPSSSRRSGQRRGRVSRCPSRPGRHEVLWAPPSESSQNLSVLPTSTASVPTTVVCGLLLASPPHHIPSSPVLFHPKGKMCNIM